MFSSDEEITEESGPWKRPNHSRYGSKSELRSSRSKAAASRPPTEYLSFHYDPLPRVRGAIRLLNLLSSSSNNPYVECELITPNSEKGDHVNADIIPYEALSWAWGTEPRNSYISIRKGQKTYAKYVPKSLFNALLALRHFQKNRYLWIDAVCIDQENFEERNHQVEMMDEIYSNAKRVCVWLGDATNESRTALSFIKEEVLKLQHFDDLCESPSASSKWRALLELMQRPWYVILAS